MTEPTYIKQSLEEGECLCLTVDIFGTECVCNVTACLKKLIKWILSVLHRYDFELFSYNLDGYLEHGMTEPSSADSLTTWHTVHHMPSYLNGARI
jgi:hypothetical protein